MARTVLLAHDNGNLRELAKLSAPPTPTEATMRLSLSLLLCVTVAACAPQSDSSDATSDNSSEGMADAVASFPDPNSPDGEENAVPTSWTFRADRSDREYTVGADSTADVLFVNMTPGWHITSGPAGIYYHPAASVSGSFTATTDIHLFDPAGRREAFGLLFGGANLDGDEQAYTYFLIRQGGEFLIKERMGDDTRVISDWTAHESIKSHEGGQDETALNKLAVRVGDSDVEFVVNDAVVATRSRDEFRTDGTIGIRVNHGLNLHVSDFGLDTSGT